MTFLKSQIFSTLDSMPLNRRCVCWLYFIMSYRRSKIYLRDEYNVLQSVLDAHQADS